MLRITIGILFIFSLQVVYAQDIGSGLEEYIKHARVNRDAEKPVLYEYVQGSPYLHESFEDARIALDIGKTFEGPVRYDIYADQIEFKNAANEIFIVQNPKAIRMLMWGDSKFNYFEPGEFPEMRGFYELLVIGNYSLYKKYQILLKNPEAAGPGFQTSVARFIPQDSKYYMMDPDANFTEINNKKDLLVPGRDKNELGKFIKNNKINPKKENDLVRFTEFLNQE